MHTANRITRYSTILSLACLLACGQAFCQQQPNVLVLTVDDMGYHSVGVFGCKVPGITPNIDKLAGEGIRFTYAFVNTAVCQPCRQSMQTGRYPHNDGAEGFEPINEDVPTLSEQLRKAGYINGILGKEIHHQPVWKFCWDYIPFITELDSVWRNSFGRNPRLYYEYSAKFFAMAKAENRPFFLLANSQDPHRPFAGSAEDTLEFAGRLPPLTRQFTPGEVDVPGFLPDIPDVRKEVAQYYGSVYRADQSIGAVLKALNESGLADNTLVIFLSDHGAAFPFSKSQCYFNSDKTPLIVRWPHRISPGTIDSTHLVSGIDLMPTILDALHLPSVPHLDGKTYLPLLLGKGQSGRDYVYTTFYQIFAKTRYPMRCLQDKDFGYIFNFWSDGKLSMTGDATAGLTWKAMVKAGKSDPQIAARVELYRHRVPEEFYDFKSDPDALHNLIDDPAYAAIIKRMRGKMAAVMRSCHDPAYAAFRNRNRKGAITEFMRQQKIKAAQTKKDAKFPAAAAPSAAQSGPRIKDYGLKDYIYLSKDLPHSESKPWKLVCQMPYNCQFQPAIRVRGAGGQVISLNSSNPLVQYLTKTESFVTGPGITDYEAKNWISGEGAVYTLPAGVTVESVQYRETGYDTRIAGSFACDDSAYTILWRKAARTGYLCMRDHFYDCPDRERVGFWGDGTPELDQCFYAFDTSSYALCKDLVLRPLQAGFYPGQQLEFLGEYGLWFYYMHTGNLQSIASVYESTKHFLFNTYKPGKRNQWFDWGAETKDIAVIETCFMYIDLKSLRKMAILTGHGEDTAAISGKLDSIKGSFDRLYWKGEYYMSSQVNTPDDRANAMAVNAGLADSSRWNAIYRNVLTKVTNASCFFDRWVFEALCQMGEQDFALRRMYDRYRTMVGCSFTTLWEHYDRWWATKKNAFDDASSLNHGWNPPVILLSQRIAGVSPEEPGWQVFHVLPREAFLRKIQVVVPTIHGNIKVGVNKTSSEYSLTVVAPAGTSAIAGIPKRSFSSLRTIRLNGTVIWAKGAYTGGDNGVAWAGEDPEYIKFRVPSGTWSFSASGSLVQPEPRSAYVAPPAEWRLNKKGWSAASSVRDSSFLFSGDNIPVDIAAANAIDGDHWTGWRDMSATQYPGQWFLVDMKSQEKFDAIELDNTWALWDSPVHYVVTVSTDGKHWGNPVAEGRGELGMTRITFPVQQARFIKITQTGTDPTYHWSIYELDVCRKK
ncbi:MAG TPA: sulfatase-like hydrolase/transferase [Puia sp.]|nr:sulfatase-like hydrolase/transferase [Puia sp.]